ncbi:hypothetical protein L2K70_19240 [Nocardioides KLBMP 9356]|uniref:Uncharacterized protein n=1 Tax=Nocardioides potassii TaxID=2911371 RepID=A0ABS9HH72_9ACTN|nr:hypothetical protein [Nocardioides potassii]MCF6379752.1 hypothetical protein [Nocardioides potassii]
MLRARAALVAGLLVVLATFAYGVENQLSAVVQRARTGVLSTMAAGALLALVGWTAMGEPRPSRRVGRPHATV